MKILFLSRWFPYPPDNGAKIRIFNLLKHLSTQHEVDLISFASEAVTEAQMTAARPYCRQVEVIPYHSFQPGHARALLGFFSTQPRSVIDTFNTQMQQCIDRAQRERAFDLVIASQIDMAPYASRVANTIKLFEEIELTMLYEQFTRQAHPLKRMRSKLTWWKLSHYMTRLLQGFDGGTVVSQAERERVGQVAPGYQPIAVVPNGVDVSHHTHDFGPPEADTLIYSGALTYKANFDAVDYFLGNIFPLVQAQRPQVKLAITGKSDGVPIERLPNMGEGVVFTGYLPDVRPAVARSWISVVPLRIGGGTRLKILEALALGTPVVATTKGAEGLNLAPGRDFLLADSPADFAAAILRLLQDANLRQVLSRNGRQAVATQYDWSIIGQQFNDFVETVVAQAKPELQPVVR